MVGTGKYDLFVRIGSFELRIVRFKNRFRQCQHVAALHVPPRAAYIFHALLKKYVDYTAVYDVFIRLIYVSFSLHRQFTPNAFTISSLFIFG